jgi:hypothetical protein
VAWVGAIAIDQSIRGKVNENVDPLFVSLAAHILPP